MTTGRINQVTILHAQGCGPLGAASPRACSKRPRRSDEDRSLVKTRSGHRSDPDLPIKGEGSPGVRDRRLRRPREGAAVDTVIHLPPLYSSRDGPPQKSVRPPKGRPRTCDMYPSRGGYRRPVDVGGITAPQRILTAAYPQDICLKES